MADPARFRVLELVNELYSFHDVTGHRSHQIVEIVAAVGDVVGKPERYIADASRILTDGLQNIIETSDSREQRLQFPIANFGTNLKTITILGPT